MAEESGSRWSAVAAAFTAVVAAGALAFAGINAATAAPSAAPPGTFYAPEEMLEIWAKDTASFPLPLAPGIEWPENPPAFMTAEDVMNEEGLSGITAAFYWLCSWEDAYITTSEALEGSQVDPAAKAAAVSSLRSFASLPIVQKRFIGSAEWAAVIVPAAKSGDIEAIKLDYRSNCGIYSAENGRVY
ncbi:hypothetical protein N1029_18830 [Herbiconiux sp. CPCC 203406]|uniref:hypothetical protein n=1 Tax=Herbiconiux oxytropis TaxID=2970915 RepID=UPI00217E7416|nr:hypothetical protein [Herbiconiux oxytropis]MCS5724054.1 hypothetical protein [Herbiconiux oxytropis]